MVKPAATLFYRKRRTASLLTATAEEKAKNEIYNVAFGDRTVLNGLFHALRSALAVNGKPYSLSLVYRDFRAGDVRHSRDDISKAANKLRYVSE